MKNEDIRTLNLQLTCNLGNYESMRLGMEWTPEAGKTVAEEMAEADKMLREEARRLVEVRRGGASAAPAPAPASAPAQEQAEQAEQEQEPAAKVAAQREKVDVDSPMLQKLCNRIEAGVIGTKPRVTMESIEQYYELTQEAREIIALAMQIQDTIK